MIGYKNARGRGQAEDWGNVRPQLILIDCEKERELNISKKI